MGSANNNDYSPIYHPTTLPNSPTTLPKRSTTRKTYLNIQCLIPKQSDPRYRNICIPSQAIFESSKSYMKGIYIKPKSYVINQFLSENSELISLPIIKLFQRSSWKMLRASSGSNQIPPVLYLFMERMAV